LKSQFEGNHFEVRPEGIVITPVEKVVHLSSVGQIITLPELVNRDQEIMNVEVTVLGNVNLVKLKLV